MEGECCEVLLPEFMIESSVSRSPEDLNNLIKSGNANANI